MKRVILCRPEGPRNVGTILRAAENFGPAELWIVSPARPSLLVHPDFEQMSHGAEVAREAIVVVDDLREALADVHHSIGFTGRVRGRRKREDWRRLVPTCLPIGSSADQRLALVFGNEVTGLTAAETDLCNELAHVRTTAEHTSLNLGMCVGVALADLFTGTKVHVREPGGSMLDGEGREFLKARLREVFADGVVRKGTAQEDVEEMIERVFSRAALLNKDARAWHLILKSLGSEMSPRDLDLTLHEKGGRRREALARRGRDRAADPEESEGTSPDQKKE
ncbi:MAG: RNA methyltransferase [bacterium]